MKKLFALMLALCLMFSVAMAEEPVEMNWEDVAAAAEEVGGQWFSIDLGLIVWAPNDFFVVNEIPEAYAEKGIYGMFAALDEEGNLTGAITLQYVEVNGASVEECVAKIEGAADPKSMVIGEAPLMKDLEDVTSVDLVTVNTISVAAIFIIVMLVFKSLTLPAILVTVIEFAIFINMAWAYYTGVHQPFVAPVVVGTIQLGATVDYAILMTTHYVRQRQSGKGKREAVSAAHRSSVVSIITSGLSLFAATVGVALYSNVDMIRAIVILLARGALISMACVLLFLPALLMLCDGLVRYTTLGMKAKEN